MFAPLNSQNARAGWTILELMIVVAIIGIMAAVAVPIFLSYIRDSKTAEAHENLKLVGDGALVYFQQETTMKSSKGMISELKMFPNDIVNCTGGGTLDGQKVSPTSTNWDEWDELKFVISRPHYYRYCYTPSADRKAFRAIAEAALEGDGAIDSIFALEGEATSDGLGLGNVYEDL